MGGELYKRMRTYVGYGIINSSEDISHIVII